MPIATLRSSALLSGALLAAATLCQPRSAGASDAVAEAKSRRDAALVQSRWLQRARNGVKGALLQDRGHANVVPFGSEATISLTWSLPRLGIEVSGNGGTLRMSAPVGFSRNTPLRELKILRYVSPFTTSGPRETHALARYYFPDNQPALRLRFRANTPFLPRWNQGDIDGPVDLHVAVRTSARGKSAHLGVIRLGEHDSEFVPVSNSATSIPLHPKTFSPAGIEAAFRPHVADILRRARRVGRVANISDPRLASIAEALKE